MTRTFSAFRHRLWHFLFDQHTRSGRHTELFCGLLALLSVVVIFIESGIGTAYQLSPTQWRLFVVLEMGFTFMFTVEYLLRVFTWPQPSRYVFSLWGIIDLATILPLYVMWLWPGLAVNYLFAWRAMRALRVLRILKLLRLMPVMDSIWRTIINARHQLILFYAFIAILLVTAGALIYAVEGAANGFTTLGTAVYWAVVTVTTVGYGDITPHTPAGRFIASLLILIGYSVIAIPTGILTAQMTSDLQRKRSRRVCPHCQAREHEETAKFCKACGSALPPRKEK